MRVFFAVLLAAVCVLPAGPEPAGEFVTAGTPGMLALLLPMMILAPRRWTR